MDPGQVVFDIQIVRRRHFAVDWPTWDPVRKKQAIEAEERLSATSGADLVKALIEYGLATGRRVRI